ncbi:two pore domain potassium channel family protein [Iamia sp. SCSIO 61187]|uniref:potassium channel family protein n=1 Tax=Iamia sp. SCSIO 61187 TaxID=2722752 RepID=UPI001C631131|nr:potassium channel family protein [Iamia sp. SCSIO 61187]QYG95255.1 two pore domain potassium channel family protein [Iamia sp. SCSIO 61187]
MTVLLRPVGLTLVVVALVDVTWTTIAAGSGGGPVTRRLASWVWQGHLRAHRRWPSHRRLTFAGVSIVLITFATWVGLVLLGWALVLASADGAVRDAATGRPAGLVERLYFTGYTVFTLGNGELRPGTGWWQVATVMATASGLVFVTLAITYLVPVASAAAERRSLASTVASLGSTPHEIVTNAWTGSGFGSLDQHLVSLTPLVHSIRQQHLAYPVLHYFHSRTADSAAAINVANLSQALHLLDHGVAADDRPDRAATGPLDRAITGFLDTLGAAFLTPSGPPLPPPDLAPLVAAGVPTVAPDRYTEAEAPSEPRRALLAALLAEDGWPAPEEPSAP